MKFSERVYWHTHSYGNAYKLNKTHLRALFVFVCIITPFTNWLIPMVRMIVKKDIIVRYER